jgi:glycyl-tRNA synthetase alpha chain
MYLQKKDDLFDLVWVPGVTYRDVYHRNEVEQSRYNFELADVPGLLHTFESSRAECERLCAAGVPLPAYDHVIRCSHTFNLLQARGAISVAERAQYIKRVRDLACLVARTWSDSVDAGGAS